MRPARLIRSAVRQAIAWIVSEGLTPPTVGKHRAVADPEIGNVPAAAIGIDDAGARIVAHARRAGQMAGVVGLRPDVAGAERFQAWRHEAERMLRSAPCRCRHRR